MKLLTRLSPLQMMVLGFVLLVIGVVIPFAQILRLLEPNLFLSFAGYFASVAGLAIGVIGLAMYSRTFK